MKLPHREKHFLNIDFWSRNNEAMCPTFLKGCTWHSYKILTFKSRTLKHLSQLWESSKVKVDVLPWCNSLNILKNKQNKNIVIFKHTHAMRTKVVFFREITPSLTKTYARNAYKSCFFFFSWINTLVPRAFPLKVRGAGKGPSIGWSRVHLTSWNPGCNKLARFAYSKVAETVCVKWTWVCF